jgi:DNA repair protein RadC
MSIKNWNEEDRPREKFLEKGKNAMTNAELLAIIMNSGNAEENAVELARRILKDADNSIDVLGKYSLKELMQYKGIGEAKAISIAAALELGLRRMAEPNDKIEIINSSQKAFEYMQHYFMGLQVEHFVVLYLNRAMKPIKLEKISEGGLSATVVDIRLIGKMALMNLASAVILAHNHPSGNLLPSESDILLTDKIKKGLQLIDVQVSDHLIIGYNDCYSFSDNGKL